MTTFGGGGERDGAQAGSDRSHMLDSDLELFGGTPSQRPVPMDIDPPQGDGERPEAGVPDPTWLLTGLRHAGGVRVRALPRPPADAESGRGSNERDRFGDFRVSTLSAAYALDDRRPVVWLAHRASRGGPVELLSSGVSVLPTEAETVSVPVQGLWERLCRHPYWTAVVARPHPWHSRDSASLDGSSAGADDADGSADASRWGLERVLARFPASCSVLVTAEPVESSIVDECVRALGQKASVVGAGGADSPRPEAAEAFKHWTGRVWQTRRAMAQGAWFLRIVVGADSSDDARDLAARMAGGFGPEVGRVGYLLAPLPTPSPTKPPPAEAALTEALQSAASQEYATSAHWHWGLPDPAAGIVPSQVVAALIRPPRVELPGVRLFVPPRFDITPEHMHDDEVEGRGDGLELELGSVLDGDRQPAGRFALSGASLNRHVFVPGATGSGKTTTVRALLAAAAKLVADGALESAENADRSGRPARRLPWMVVEPEKAEYARAMAPVLNQLDERLVVIRPGDLGSMRAGIDPLRPAPGFGLQTHIDLVRTLFLAAFDAEEPFPQVLSLALNRCYTEQGWDLTTGRWRYPGVEPRYPTLADLQRTASMVIGDVGYGREVADNVQGFIKVRLSSLRVGTTGQFLEAVNQIDFGRLLNRFVVIELEDIGDDHHKAFLMGAVLIGLVEHLRVQAQRSAEWANAGLRHLTVFEEAHRLLRKETGSGSSGSSGHAVRMIAGLLAEIRAYGEGLVIADQIPGQLIDDVVKNTAVKLMHRLPAKDDRDAVGATMNLNERQSEFVVTLPPGQAAAFADGMDAPVLLSIPPDETRPSDTAKVDGPDSVVEPEMGRCRVDYGLGPITGETQAMARQLHTSEPGIQLWAELATVARLTGQPVPVPRSDWLETLHTNDTLLLRTALALAIDDAVADRSRHFSDRVSARALAEHLWSLLVPMLTATESPPEAAEVDPTWIATPFRWDAVGSLLESLEAQGETIWRPESGSAYASLVGNRVPGEDLAEQITHVKRNERLTDDEAETAINVYFGDARPPVIDGVVPGRPVSSGAAARDASGRDRIAWNWRFWHKTLEYITYDSAEVGLLIADEWGEVET